MNEVADPGMIQQLWDWGHNFVTSPVFFVSVGLFIVWMLVFRLGRFVKDVIVGIFGAIFGMVNLDRWRRVFFNMFSLIAMVGGTAGAFAAKASLGDGNVKLEALYGGGIAFAVWGALMLVSNQVDRFVPPKTKSPKRKEESGKKGK